MSIVNMIGDGHKQNSVAVDTYRKLESGFSKVHFSLEYFQRRYDCRFGRIHISNNRKHIDIYIDEAHEFTICYGGGNSCVKADDVLATVKAIFTFA